MLKNYLFTYLKKIPLHIIFWFLTWFFFYSFFSVGTKNPKFLFWFSTILSFISICISYIFGYSLVPKYLLAKKYWRFLLYTIYTAILLMFGVLTTVVFGFVFYFDLEYKSMPELTKNASVILVCVVLIVVFFTGIKILRHSYKSIEEKKNLKNKFLQTQLQLKEQELKFLKMQIHPHFLFNSLNTIYGFALKKADKAPEMILKLSNLLDYILYQVEKPVVLLQNEIDHLKDYVSLEKMRFHDTLNVSISEEGNTENVQIAPMLLIPFVENSFKHGTIIDGKLKVVISIKIENELLFFKISNSTLEETSNETGIGLDNIKKRLEMLYPNGHQLKIEQENQLFIVALKVKIKSLNILKNDH